MFSASDIYRAVSSAIRSPTQAFFSSSSSSSTSTAASLPSLNSNSQHQTQAPAMSLVEKFVEDTIANNKIVVFSKSWCPFCKQTKQYFARQYPKQSVEVVEIDDRSDEYDIQNYLMKKTGARTVPRIFINGEFVGGNDALRGKPKHEIDALIAKRN